MTRSAELISLHVDDAHNRMGGGPILQQRKPHRDYGPLVGLILCLVSTAIFFLAIVGAVAVFDRVTQ